jgi:hypothetical protein
MHRRTIAMRPTRDTICVICQEALSKATFVCQLHCRHQFHFTCYKQWRHPTCPLCRYQTTLQVYHNIYPCTWSRYNRRYFPSVYNLVLWELRRYMRYCPGTTLVDKPTFQRVKRRVARIKMEKVFTAPPRQYSMDMLIASRKVSLR